MSASTEIPEESVPNSQVNRAKKKAAPPPPEPDVPKIVANPAYTRIMEANLPAVSVGTRAILPLWDDKHYRVNYKDEIGIIHDSFFVIVTSDEVRATQERTSKVMTWPIGRKESAIDMASALSSVPERM